MLLKFILIILIFLVFRHPLLFYSSHRPSFFGTYRSLPFLLRYLLNGFPGLSTDISEHICLLLLVLFCFPFLVLGFRAVDKGDSCRLLSSR